MTGAIADCENMKDFLEKSLEEVHIEELHNKKATREGIEKAINGLANHDRISVGDPILIYYAGHGSEIDPPEHWNLPYGSRKIQMILPYDYDIGGQGLLDVTLRELLTRLSDNKGDNIVSVSFFRTIRSILHPLWTMVIGCNIGFLQFGFRNKREH